MANVLTKKQRSYNMPQIRSKNTEPELTLRKLLSKIRYQAVGFTTKKYLENQI